MNILTPVIVVAVIGIIAGVVLSVASVIMAVPVNERVEKLREALPGVNCGACGYSGCDAYANAIDAGAKVLNLCSPGGADVAQDIGEIMGVTVGAAKAKKAVVRCLGNCENAPRCYDYDGITSCVMASQLLGGPSSCKYGCIGLGDCVKVCEYGAISICNGIAVVDKELCTGCKKCAVECPKNIIKIVNSSEPKSYVYCVNEDKGVLTKQGCKVGCIGCMKCKKVCPSNAITVANNLAHIHADKCTNCGFCVSECPSHCIDELIKQL